MLVINALALATGFSLIAIGATGRLTTLTVDSRTGRDVASTRGNAVAIAAGLCVIAAAVT